MTPLDFIFWATEFALEGFGAIFSFKRRIWPLFAYLYFRTLADLVCFYIYHGAGQNAFYWADWWQRAVQYPLMAVLIFTVIEKLLNDSSPRIRAWAGWLEAAALAIPFLVWPITAQMLIRQELVANMFFGFILCLALAMRKEVKAPWGAISAGILIQVGSEAVLTLGLLKGLDTSRYYSTFATIALITWCVAVRPKFQVSEARLGIGARGFGR